MYLRPTVMGTETEMKMDEKSKDFRLRVTWRSKSASLILWQNMFSYLEFIELWRPVLEGTDGWDKNKRGPILRLVLF